MRILITGEQGFIAKNLKLTLENRGHTVLDPQKFSSTLKLYKAPQHQQKEVDIVNNNWRRIFKLTQPDAVVHNAALVGSDVVYLSSKQAVDTNIQGTVNIAQAAKDTHVPVLFYGTTVSYDVKKYQASVITETSDTGPTTLYGALKLSGEYIVKSILPDNKWMILRPLFAYGGIGDMNSLIAKTIFAVLKKEKIDMFLDPLLIKDYMHVNDFCIATAIALEQNLWGEDYNISSTTPMPSYMITKIISDVLGTNAEDFLEWHPKTDYLGNHVLSSEKFRRATGWKPMVALRDGIEMSYKDIQRSLADNGEYNPLLYLESAKKKGIDLLKTF